MRDSWKSNWHFWHTWICMKSFDRLSRQWRLGTILYLFFFSFFSVKFGLSLYDPFVIYICFSLWAKMWARGIFLLIKTLNNEAGKMHFKSCFACFRGSMGVSQQWWFIAHATCLQLNKQTACHVTVSHSFTLFSERVTFGVQHPKGFVSMTQYSKKTIETFTTKAEPYVELNITFYWETLTQKCRNHSIKCIGEQRTQ